MKETTFQADEISMLLKAMKFAADRHRNQRRKGTEDTPYINHPIAVAEILWNEGEVRDLAIVVAAVLHDTVEDTKTTFEEIESLFGGRVRSLVAEVTDDKSLAKAERKRLQVEQAPHLSSGAKQIKLADKITNIYDVGFNPPGDWPPERRIEYLNWAEDVVSGLRGSNSKLEDKFIQVLSLAREELIKSSD